MVAEADAKSAMALLEIVLERENAAMPRHRPLCRKHGLRLGLRCTALELDHSKRNCIHMDFALKLLPLSFQQAHGLAIVIGRALQE